MIAGYFLPFISNKTIERFIAWTISIITVCFSVQITSHETPLYRMAAIASLQLLSMKLIVMIETYSGKPRLSFIQWSAFSLGWFGMRPVLFEKLPSARLPYSDLLFRGISRLVIGFTLIYLSALLERYSFHSRFIDDLFLLLGLSFILHFGILNISTALWRLSGVDVRELFRAPYKAKSLTEFWGKRWNMAFSEMTSIIVYRPLKNNIGKTWAMIASFLLSGILHEIAISFPVKSGYGLPLLYFVIQGTVMYLESHVASIKKIITDKVASHLWVMAWLVLPLPLLFHKDFISLVLMPLRDVLLQIVH